jgi:ABC-2 type transport system ATP-binding protein
LLLLDEPTNGLDIPSKSQFRKIVVSSVNEEQLVLISTHQVKDIDTIIDTLVVVDNGAIVYQNDMATIGRNYLFETAQNLDNKKDIIYQELSPMGYRVIRPADGDEETTIDLELLFNAIINKKEIR